MGAGKEQREAPSLGVQPLSHTKHSCNVTSSLSKVQGMGGSAPLPPSARLLQGKGEQQAAEPWVSTAWGCRGSRGHQPFSSPHRILPLPSWLCCPDAVGSLPRGFSRGTRDGEGDRRLRRSVTVWAGRAASLATSPPRTLQLVGSVPELLQQPLAPAD